VKLNLKLNLILTVIFIFVILFILIIQIFEKKISLSFIIPDTENLVPLDANDQYYTDMFNPFKKINESKRIIKISPDGFLQPPPVRFNNAIKIIKNNEISLVYIGHLSDLILNSLGDLNNTKNKQLKNLIYYLKSKNIKISSSIDIERCVLFLSHNYDYGLRSFFLSVDEAVILIRDKNIKLEDILLCKKNLKNINSKINISLDLYIESFVADKLAYAKLVKIIKNFNSFDNRKFLRIYVNSFGIDEDQLKLIKCLKSQVYYCDLRKNRINTIDIVAHPTLYSLNLIDYKPIIPPPNTKDKNLYVEKYKKEIKIINKHFKRFKKLENNLIIFLLPIGYNVTSTISYTDVCKVILGERCIVLNQKIFEEQLTIENSQKFYEKFCKKEDTNEKKNIKFIKKLCFNIANSFEFEKEYLRTEHINFLQSNYFLKQIDSLKKTSLKKFDQNEVSYYSYGQSYEQCATTWGRLFFDFVNVCAIPIYDLSISAFEKHNDLINYELIQLNNRVNINEWSNYNKSKFLYFASIHRDLLEYSYNKYLVIKNFDPSCAKLYDLSGQIIPMINAESNFKLPLNSGIRGLNSNVIYLETCKKINLNDVSVSN
jgi:hypothetical protein